MKHEMVEGRWGIHRDFRTNWRCAYPIIHVIPICWTEEGMHFYVLRTTFETSHPFFFPPTNPQHNLLLFVAIVPVVITHVHEFTWLNIASSKTLFFIRFWKPSHNPMNENAQRNWYQDLNIICFHLFERSATKSLFTRSFALQI